MECTNSVHKGNVLIHCQKTKNRKNVLQRKQRNHHGFAARTSSGWVFFIVVVVLVFLWGFSVGDFSGISVLKATALEQIIQGH